MRVSALLALLLPVAAEAADAPRRAVILYTASVQGELEDCGCKDARGGLARRHAYVAEVRRRSEAPVFLVDVGDSLRRVPPGQVLGRADALRRDRFLVAMQARLGLDARALGPLDLALGRARLEQLFSAPETLAANLAPEGGEESPGRPLEAFRLVSRGGVRLGLVGVAPDDLPPAQTPGFRASPARAAVRDAAAAARGAGAEVVVLLSTLGLSGDLRLAEEGPGVELILGGRSRDLLRRPIRRAGIPIMQAGVRGRAVGRVDLVWGDRSLTVQHQVVDLTPDMHEDLAAREAVRTFLVEPGAP
jgi:2',3'-cyclic-nucleotide 2'-phosphodiesterase (5'-nucleotidase family)